MFWVILLYLEVILTLVSALHSPCRWNVKHLCACFLPKLQALSRGLSLMEKVSGMKNRLVSRGYRAQNACMRVRGRLTVLCFPSKMRWMLAINSAVTISWRVEASRISSRRLGQNNSLCVCVWVGGWCFKHSLLEDLWGPLSLYKRWLYADWSELNLMVPFSICSFFCLFSIFLDININ